MIVLAFPSIMHLKSLMQKPPEAFVPKLAEPVAHLLEEPSLQCQKNKESVQQDACGTEYIMRRSGADWCFFWYLSLWFLERKKHFLFIFIFLFYKKEQSWSLFYFGKGAQNLCSWYFIPLFFRRKWSCVYPITGRSLNHAVTLPAKPFHSVYNDRYANAHTQATLINLEHLCCKNDCNYVKMESAGSV